MHLFVTPGTQILFTGNGGHGTESDIAKTFLVPGVYYTVKDINVTNRWVQLAEWPDQWWNIELFFADFDNDGDNDLGDGLDGG